MNTYVEQIMMATAKRMLTGDGVCVPDDAEEMNWRLFFAHSQDMQGFRADIFTGGQNEEPLPGYLGLRDRCTTSKDMMEGLAAFWESGAMPIKPVGLAPTMEALRGPLGNSATRIFADALEDLRGARISRKSNSMIRAYCQNSSMLRKHGFSFRDYLLSICPLPERGGDIVAAERMWVSQIERDFFNVGETLAYYMVCDWLLWLWREGKIEWFSSYKPDSVHLRIIEEGKLPAEAADFAGYCRSLSMISEWVPKGYERLIGAPVPPRILNEAIWVTENRSSSREPEIIQFADDDSGYLRWLTVHNSSGFVVNSNRKPSAKYLVLHKATCHSINGEPTNGKDWTVEYLKTCSISIDHLSEWAQSNLGAELYRCKACKP